jgi:8-oxo-dGTP pyrophosphatase MutT (NUDIX family)
MKRHFTVTTFISSNGKTLLHWHKKNQMWLPPGGHIEPDEDPYEAALREVQEEIGFGITLLKTVQPYPYYQPQQLPPPVTIMIENIPATSSEPAHQHIDLIYFAKPSVMIEPIPINGIWYWVSSDVMQENRPFAPNKTLPPISIPEDVRILGLAAIEESSKENF